MGGFGLEDAKTKDFEFIEGKKVILL